MKIRLRYFNIDEFDSPDQPGSGSNMQLTTLQKLDKARHSAGIPFYVSSGFRTTAHNLRVGGVNGSSHTKGYAVDIKVIKSQDRFKIINAAMAAGFNRIGIAKSFVHLDNDPDKIKNVIWTY